MSDPKIYRLMPWHLLRPGVVRQLNKLIPQMSSSAKPLRRRYLVRILFSSTQVYVAEVGGRIVGTASVDIVTLLTGRKAWVEDVVVDEHARGLRLGFGLMDLLVSAALRGHVKHINLTSKTGRDAAHGLYTKLGFEVRTDTEVFRKVPI